MAPTREEGQVPKVVPDLLFQKGELRIDAKLLQDNLPFAFVSGDSDGSIDRALSDMQVGASRWNPDVYVDELFLDDLIDLCMRPTFSGFSAPIHASYVKRVLSSPPHHQGDVAFRHEALQELWSQEGLRQHLVHTYQELCRMIGFFDAPSYGTRYDDLERRLEIVHLIRKVIQGLDKMPEVQSAAFARTRQFAASVVASDAYQQLDQFLNYKDNLASVELRLAVRVDGKIGSFEVCRISEDQDNRFHQSPLRRLFRKIFLFLRGYRFTEMEIIERWIDRVFTATLEFLPPLIQLKGDLDVFLAAMGFRQECEAKGLFVCLPTFVETNTTPLTVRQLFNPLLFSQDIVPTSCTIETRSADSMMIVTGPNSGGKTRLLQAMAITQLLGQAGIYVPAEEARLRWTHGMFVSLVEGAKLDHAEGRLGTEMLRIRRVFEQCGDVSLVIIDELCSGTNPSEGEEIFYLVMTLLRKLKPLAFVTTHFLQFASRLEKGNELALEFLQVELDTENKPTFKFVAGVATSSLARETAARLGVTQDELLALIESKQSAS